MLVLGDTHGNLEFVEDACHFARRNGCDRIVQVGDWGFLWNGQKGDRLKALTNKLAEFGQHMWFIDGNHEWYGRWEEMGFGPDSDEPFALSERVTYLPRGYAWEWGGVRFMALGGAYSIDRLRRTKFIDHWPQEEITWAQAERAITAGPVDVMFTHDAPHGLGHLDAMLAEGDSSWAAAFGAKWYYQLKPGSQKHRELVRAVVDEVRPRVLIHGHYHYRHEDTLEGDGYTTKVTGLDCDGTGAEAWVVLDTDEF